MKRTQALTASAIVAAGLMLRPGQSISPVHVAAPGSEPPSSATEANVGKDDGPWLASCKYWAAARGGEPETKDKKTTVSISIADENERVDSTVVATGEQDPSSCRVDNPNRFARWGIPRLPGNMQPDVHAVIAAVTDPMHTHLALEFDRDIDALVQAAGDNGYVPSYYWLPWRNHAGAFRNEGTPSREGSERFSAREHQPGLIIFKQVPDKKKPGYPWSGYSKVIYLFLVGTTPTLGMDGTQLMNAFKHESDLYDSVPNVTFSMKARLGMAIVGPSSSGSAASLHEGVQSAHEIFKDISPALNVDIAGSTSTDLANDFLSKGANYISFGDDVNFELRELTSSLISSGHSLQRVAILSEDSTAYAAAATELLETEPFERERDAIEPIQKRPYIARFPRGISLLRNAHADSDEPQSNDLKSLPSPFLHLSLRDPGADDSVSQFSSEQMPLSQEAQLMAISRQLQRNRTEFIVILASNVLDQLFLAQFLHRACPDARLVVIGGDLLYEREIDNGPFIGTVTFSPYNLAGLATSYRPTGPVRAFTDSATEAYFNAASYTFWDGCYSSDLHLADYSNPFVSDTFGVPLLWATAVGTDGYYPLGVVKEHAKLPGLQAMAGATSSQVVPSQCKPRSAPATQSRIGGLSVLARLTRLVRFSDPHYDARPYRYPSLSWQALCFLIGLLCFVHALAVSFPNYWSPFTRDLAIAQGDQRQRRSMYIHIGTTMLFSMAFVTAYPVFPSFRFLHPNWQTAFYSLWALSTASVALWATWRKTRSYLRWRNLDKNLKSEAGRLEQLRLWCDENLVFLFNASATLALVLIPALWVWICHTERVNGWHNYVGPLFSFRCLHPGSGVSPLVPVLLICFGWYLWAVLQGLRLRFSDKTRPLLPESTPGTTPWPLFVSDEDVSRCGGVPDSCLTANITCLLITREVVKRFFPNGKWWPTACLFGLYIGLFCVVIFGLRLESLDRFLWEPGFGPTPYEFLTAAIAFPLIVIGLAGWLRVILIWGSLKRGLLEPLERLPIRYAFTRLKGVGWMSMMRQSGLLEHWRDMARSTESMRQMVHDPALLNGFYPGHEDQKNAMQQIQKQLDGSIAKLQSVISQKSAGSRPKSEEVEQAGVNCMHEIERCYARFCQALLRGVLIPYWETTRVGLVESDDFDELPIKAHSLPRDEGASRSYTPLALTASSVAEEAMHIRAAEEFLAIRYVSFIRAVLVNMRYLIMFISAVFVLTIVAWNSYPFQPRQWIDGAFTGLLLLLGTGVIWVFAQMYRSPILSRITDTNANELGIDFYLRIVTFGAVPVLTWLAYQFPDVGSTLFKFIQPGLDVVK